MIIEFSDKAQFTTWLSKNASNHDAIWIRIYKDTSKKSITAEDALDCSLCYGWIDGKIKSEGVHSYIKYFSPRREKSVWSEKNKKSIKRLRKDKLMTPYGEAAVKKAIQNGQWNSEKKPVQVDYCIADFSKLFRGDKLLRAQFDACSPSIKKRFCGFYFDAKTEETKRKRFEKIKAALQSRFKGMLY